MNDKQSLRAQHRAARAHAPRTPIPVSPPFTALLHPNAIVAFYVPTGSEADPKPHADAALAAGCTLALPHVVDRALPLRFLRWNAGDPLVEGPFGLRQPESDAETCDPSIILTPLVGFDRAGNRLGQGAGHYDRAFAAHPQAIRVGIAWSMQEVDALSADPWDVPLHHIATEKEWITPVETQP